MEALSDYNSKLSSGEFSQAEAMRAVMDDFSEELSMYEGLKEELAGILQRENGEGLSFTDSLAALTDAQTLQETFDSQITAATEEATAAREAALQEFTTTLATIQEGFTASEAAGALAMVEQAGIAVSDLDRAMIEGGTQAVADLATAISKGETDIKGAMTTAITGAGSAAASTAALEGSGIGSDLMDGLKNGINAALPGAMARARDAARAVVNAFKKESKIESPSKVMRDEVGAMLMQGVGKGIEQEMPKTLQIIRSATAGLISSATSVVNNGAYTVPITQTVAAVQDPFDYERLADAVSRRPIQFGVDSQQLSVATREASARQQAVRVQQVNAGYGSKGAIR